MPGLPDVGTWVEGPRGLATVEGWSHEPASYGQPPRWYLILEYGPGDRSYARPEAVRLADAVAAEAAGRHRRQLEAAGEDQQADQRVLPPARVRRKEARRGGWKVACVVCGSTLEVDEEPEVPRICGRCAGPPYADRKAETPAA